MNKNLNVNRTYWYCDTMNNDERGDGKVKRVFLETGEVVDGRVRVIMNRGIGVARVAVNPDELFLSETGCAVNATAPTHACVFFDEARGDVDFGFVVEKRNWGVEGTRGFVIVATGAGRTARVPVTHIYLDRAEDARSVVERRKFEVRGIATTKGASLLAPGDAVPA